MSMTNNTLVLDGEPQDPAKGLFIRIYMAPVQDKRKSLEAGYPVFEDVPFIQIKIPGDQTYERNGRMTEEEKRLYPRHWRAFQENQKTEGIVGQILDEWTPMPRSVVESFRHFSVRTVEQLAEMSDANAGRIPQGKVWRDKAKAWIDAAKADAPRQKMDAEIAELRRRVDSLQKERDEAMKALDKATAPTQRELGRKG